MANILLVAPENPVTFWSFDEALKMAGKGCGFPPLGLLTIAAMLQDEHDARVVDMSVHPLEDGDLVWADLVLTSSMIVHWKSLESVIARCNAIGVPVLNGGPLATQYHQDITGDAVFYLGEAENGFLDVVTRMLHPSYAIAREYVDRRGDFKSLEATPIPRWDLVDLNDYACVAIQMTRGCPESCTFCNIPALYGSTTRVKAQNGTIQELQRLYDLGWRGSVMIIDDNFVGNAEQIRRVLEEDVIPWQRAHRYPFRFNTQASIRVSDNPELLEAMRLAGFVKVFAGIESPVAESLKFMAARKNLQGTTPLLLKVRALQKTGFEVQAGFIMGLDTDPDDIGDVMLAFIREAGIPVAMVGPLGVLPDTPDHKRFTRMGRLVEGASYGGDSGIFSRGLSFKPLDRADGTDGTEWLLAQHRELVRRLNSPEIFFERCLTLFAHRGPDTVTKNHPDWSKARAFFLSLAKQGIFGSYRSRYWRYLLTALWRHPKSFPDAMKLAIQGHHLIKTTERALQADEVHTFLEDAIAELERWAQGSRDAYTNAGTYASSLMAQLSRKFKDARHGQAAVEHNVSLLLKAAKKQCRRLRDDFGHQFADLLNQLEMHAHQIRG